MPKRSTREEWLDLIRDIGVWKRGQQRAVNKPLLTLMLIARAQRGESRSVPYEEIHADLKRHLAEFGPPRATYHTEFPFWYLQNDGFWEVRDGEALPFRKSKSQPTHRALLAHEAVGEVPARLWRHLEESPELRRTLARDVLSEFWPDTYHEEIATALGLDLESVGNTPAARRDPKFREAVLDAYERQCAVCGFNGRLRDTLFGLEAAHIRFRQSNGPDTITNGVALCSLHHKAFDWGAIGISKDLRIRVSEQVSGQEAVRDLVLEFSGKLLRGPQSRRHAPGETHLAWHAKNVFRGPARDAARR